MSEPSDHDRIVGLEVKVGLLALDVQQHARRSEERHLELLDRITELRDKAPAGTPSEDGTIRIVPSKVRTFAREWGSLILWILGAVGAIGGGGAVARAVVDAETPASETPQHNE